MIHYVVGFAFSFNKKELVLIHKERPDFQKNKLNGVGGKRKEDPAKQREFIETSKEAMVREFEEETGVKINDFELYATCIDLQKGITLDCYRFFTDRIYQTKTMTDERIGIYSVADLDTLPLLENLKVLIPMAIDTNFKIAQLGMNLDNTLKP